MTRSASPSCAMPTSAPVSATSARNGSRWVEPHCTLMSVPSKSSLIDTTSAPRRRSASALVMQDAPWPASSATLRPAKSMPSPATVDTACAMYSSQASSTGSATPTSSPFGSSSADGPPAAR